MKKEEFYSRHIKLKDWGMAAQKKLEESCVVIIGAGGLGCPAALYLAGAGVGRIVIVDADTVTLSNLPRQVVFTTSDLGKRKAEILAREMRNRNPFISVDAMNVFFGVSNAMEIIEPADLVIDGSDNFATRYLVNDACVLGNKPFISASLFEYEAQLSLFNYRGGPTYRCLYPVPPLPGQVPSCAVAGVLNTLVGWAGTLVSQEAIKTLTQTGNLLNGRLLILNALNSTVHEFGLTRSSVQVKELKMEAVYCHSESIIDVAEWMSRFGNKPGSLLVDVREEWETPYKNALHIPVGDLPQRLSCEGVDRIGFICEYGHRSQLASNWLEQEYPHIESFVVSENRR